MTLGADDHLPDLAHDFLQEAQTALVSRDHALPVPLIDVGAVIVIEEVVFADGPHIGAEPFARLQVELLQRHPLPLGRGLDHLGVDGVLIAVVGDVELDRRAGPIPVKIVVNARFLIHNQRHGDHHQVQFFAEIFFDIVFHLEDCPLGFFG